MNLIEVYIQEVIRRLPEKSRADIALELRSTIEDTLPDDYTEEDVKKVLEKLGNPAVLASGYRDQPMHLIGPRYFDLYVSLLKMILPIASLIALISVVVEYFVGYTGDGTIASVVQDILVQGIGTIIEVGIQVFFWLTIVFAMIERIDQGKEQQPLSAGLKKWTPDDLKNIPYIPKEKEITKIEVFGSLLWTAIWATLYFYADHLIGVHESGGNRLDPEIPAFNQEVLLAFWPIVLVVIAVDISLALYKFIKRQWTKNLAILNIFIEIFATIVLIVIVSNPHLLNEAFVTYMSEIFSTTAQQFEVGAISSVIVIKLIFAVISIIDGFRKARIQSKIDQVYNVSDLK